MDLLSSNRSLTQGPRSYFESEEGKGGLKLFFSVTLYNFPLHGPCDKRFNEEIIVKTFVILIRGTKAKTPDIVSLDSFCC